MERKEWEWGLQCLVGSMNPLRPAAAKTHGKEARGPLGECPLGLAPLR